MEYFDIFYSHRYDSTTPIEETMQALIDIVKQGKALYVGLSNYPADKAREAMAYLNAQHVPSLIYQGKYSMFNRQPEEEILPVTHESGSGFIAFSPLAQGVLTDKYLDGIPDQSRAADPTGFLRKEQVTEELVAKVRKLNEIARDRGQTMAEMAVAWTLRDERVTSVIVGTRNVKQLQDNLGSLNNLRFTSEELALIDNILGGATL